MSDFQITERWLSDSGGWSEMKQARMLVKAGAVIEASFDGRCVKGEVSAGGKRLRTGLLIRGKTDIENLCGCSEARRSGIICKHALAVALATISDGSSATERRRNDAPPVSSKDTKGAKKKEFALPDHACLFRFAKNFTSALEKGSIGIRVESVPTLPLEDSDLPFLAWLERMGESRVPEFLLLKPNQLADLATSLQGHPRLYVGDRSIELGDLPFRPTLHLTSPNTDRVNLTLEVPSGVVVIPGENQSWVWLEERELLLPLPTLRHLPPEERKALLLTDRRSSRPFERSWRWFFQHHEALEDAFQLDVSALATMPSVTPGNPRFRFEFEGSLNHLAGKLTSHYGDFEVTPGESDVRFPYPDPEAPYHFIERNPSAEAAASERLTRAGFGDPDATGSRTLRGQNAILRFFASELPRLQKDWEVRIGERFGHVTAKVDRVRPVVSTRESLEPGWLDVDLGFSSDSDVSLSRQEIQRLLQVGQSHTRLPNGRIAAVDLEACEDLNEVLRDVNPDQRYGSLRMPIAQGDYLRSVVTTIDDLSALKDAEFPKEALRDLESILRDYQKKGICWMLGRTERGLSGILADEMGLGKTLQSLSLIQALHHNRSDSPTSLIVCPTTLLDNWAAEAARFTPDLKTQVVHGAQRKTLWPKLSQFDLLITSYGSLVRDIEHYQKLELCAAIIDEASAIKNPTTQNAKTVCSLPAKYRFALTGTPIENSVRDLWSIMRFVAPGYLGEHRDFKDRYEIPLAAQDGGSPAVQNRLRRRLHPFLLRRTKKSVAKDLPDRLEKVLTCSLSSFQQELYTEVLRAGREKVLDARGKSEGAARMTMLTTLLRLRQVCCDARLLNLDPKTLAKQKEGAFSAKMESLKELLVEAMEGGHRVLVFSQFVGMLKLIQDQLAADAIDYCYLDGQTRDRGGEVRRFQESKTIPVFLISLKAGGYGLNLTAADTVVHFDPWWNPAVEAQATDRAHRIGQQNVVTSYKLITKDTVEEKILRLQRKKRNVIDAALDDQQPMMSGLTLSDLESVLDV